ncbi:hypothetical protein HYX00_01485 [Candidatus Woesearchaeota archaeon]|nr:hypothetical protein [Candidatus Woesearchaeota archaeon]
MGRIRSALRALFGKSKLDSETATEMAQKRWKKEDIKEEVGTFSQMSKLMNEMDTFKQQQIERERQREIELEERITEKLMSQLGSDDEDGGSSIEDMLLLKLFGGVNPQMAAQAPLQNNVLPTILQNPKVQMLIQAFDKIPEDKLKGLLEKLEKWA